MKKITYLIIGILLLSSNFSQAQVQLDTIYIRKKATPSTFVEVRYYYYPNLQAYFDTKIAMYIYKQNGQWVKSEQINGSYRGYSLRNNYYVMLKNFTEDDPFNYIAEHTQQYPADYSSKPKPPKAKVTEPTTTVSSTAVAAIE